LRGLGVDYIGDPLSPDFADEITKSGLQPSSKEAFMLLAHRKRFVSKD
jgi:hypothetical protein